MVIINFLSVPEACRLKEHTSSARRYLVIFNSAVNYSCSADVSERRRLFNRDWRTYEKYRRVRLNLRCTFRVTGENRPETNEPTDGRRKGGPGLFRHYRIVSRELSVKLLDRVRTVMWYDVKATTPA